MAKVHYYPLVLSYYIISYHILSYYIILYHITLTYVNTAWLTYKTDESSRFITYYNYRNEQEKRAGAAVAKSKVRQGSYNGQPQNHPNYWPFSFRKTWENTWSWGQLKFNLKNTGPRGTAVVLRTKIKYQASWVPLGFDSFLSLLRLDVWDFVLKWLCSCPCEITQQYPTV